MTQLVLRLRPDVRLAAGEALGDALVADLQRSVGQPLAGASATKEGNHVLTLASAVDIATAKQLVNALRLRGDVDMGRNSTGQGCAVRHHQGDLRG